VFLQQIHNEIGQKQLNVDVVMVPHEVIYDWQYMKTAEERWRCN
jgi:hypothetical protein